MDISEIPMCEDHPNIPAEVLCIKHKQFVCMTCAVEEKKHATKKCDCKPIKNLTSENELKLVSLLAMKTGIMGKRKKLESHISDTDEKRIEVRAMIEKFKLEINEEFQKKLESTLKSVDKKSSDIQETNKKKLDKIDAVNSLFEAEIDRLTNKKSKQSKEDEQSLQALRDKAHNLPFTGLRITHTFTPNKEIKEILQQPATLGNVLFEEDDEGEMYDELQLDYEGGYLEPVRVKSQKQEEEGLKVKDDRSRGYENLRIKSDDVQKGYKQVAVVNSQDKKKPTGRKSLPLPEVPSEYKNTTIQKDSNTKLKLSVKATESKGAPSNADAYYENQEQVTQSMTKGPTSPEPKSFSKKTGNDKTSSSLLQTPAIKKADGQSTSKEVPKRSSSLLEKIFQGNEKVLSANAVQTSAITPGIKNKSVTLSGGRAVKRRITKLTMLGPNRIVLLDESNSAILLVKPDGTVVSEQKGEKFTHVVGNGRDTVAVLGRGHSLQITTFMAFGDRKLEEQSCIKLEATVAEVTGFNFDSDSGDYAICGLDQVVIMSDSGRTRRSLSFTKCLPGKQNNKNLRTTYDFQSNSVYILNAEAKYVKRFDFGKGQVRWDLKIENGLYTPSEIVKGNKMIYVSYSDCIKVVATEDGKTAETVKTKTLLDHIMGLFIDEVKSIGVVSSASESLEGSNKFAFVAL